MEAETRVSCKTHSAEESGSRCETGSSGRSGDQRGDAAMTRPVNASHHTANRLVIALVVIHCSLLAWCARQNSPVLQEPAHLAAGLSHLTTTSFDLYRVNPPLVRMVAALPLVYSDVRPDWTRLNPDPLQRAEFDVGQDFLRANADRIDRLFFWPRIAVMPFSVIGLVVCYLWARDLFGTTPGLTAAMLWSFSPTILGHASLITPDAHAAALAVAAMYCFYRWLRIPTWTGALLAGTMLGLAELSKATLLLIYPTLPVVWLLNTYAERTCRRKTIEATMLGLIVCVSLVVLNAGYGFDGFGQNLREFQFKSDLLRRVSGGQSDLSNALADSWIAGIPIPLPADFVQGVDAQRTDFEMKKRSYLNGEWKVGGWRHFYLQAILMKTPIGTLVLVALSTVAAIFYKDCRLPVASEAALLLPALTILIVVSSHTGFSIHPRYILPILPFAFVWISRVAVLVQPQRRCWSLAVLVSLTAATSSSLWCFPHEISYVNELYGGPREGRRNLLDSGFAWGQDLFYLQRWVKEHPEAKPLFAVTFGYVDPAILNISYRMPTDDSIAYGGDRRPGSERLPPGWYAVDVNYVMGGHDPAYHPGGSRRLLGGWRTALEDFADREPIARCGYSIHVYRVAPSSAVRSEEKRSSARRCEPCSIAVPLASMGVVIRSVLYGAIDVSEPQRAQGQDGAHRDGLQAEHRSNLPEDASGTSTSLVEAAQASDPAAWQRLVDEFSSRVYRWCRRSGLGQEDAADVAQEVFVAAWRNIGNFRRDRPGDSLRKWIRAITTNKVRDFYRKTGLDASIGGTTWMQRLHQLFGEDASTSISDVKNASLRPVDPRLAAIEQVRAEVNHRDWTIFERAVIDEQVTADIARDLEISANVVYLVKSRILKRVRERFDRNQTAQR